MLTTSLATTPAAAILPLFDANPAPDKASGLFQAAAALAQLLGQGRALDSRALRSAMEAAFGASDAAGAWVWKDAYEASEAAQVLFLRKFGGAMRARAGSPASMLEMLFRLADRLPSQTRRSEESERFQQFSTPITLGFVAAEAAALTAADLVLEPSAGTGLLAIFAEIAKARLAFNEIADTRAALLARLFRDGTVTRHNAEQIHDHLDPGIRPDVVLMNPPFSASPNVEGRFAEAAIRHIASALARLAEGGRLVAITGRNVGPDQPAWRDSFIRLQEKSRVVFRQRSPVRPMPATARRPRHALPSLIACPRRIRVNFHRRREWLPTPPNCSIGSSVSCRRARPSPAHRRSLSFLFGRFSPARSRHRFRSIFPNGPHRRRTSLSSLTTRATGSRRRARV
jgi:hypothetical protein